MTHTRELDDLRSVIKRCKRVLTLTGAGVSAESGVPTFRGGGKSTVWRGMPFEALSSVEMVERDLPLVWEWFDYRRQMVRDCRPNAAHLAIADAQGSRRFERFTLVTQNIDGLHSAAGSTDVIELHGNIYYARCVSCGNREQIDGLPEAERPPICPSCEGAMRPNVVLFGEAMPRFEIEHANEMAASCDVCIVIGTSAIVYPAAGIPLIAKRSGGSVIEINPEKTALTPTANISIQATACEAVPRILAV